MKNSKTQILFVKHEDNSGLIEGNVLAYFPAEHKIAGKINGKVLTFKENPGVTYSEENSAEKSEYRNLLTDLLVSGEKNVLVLNKQ